jgi:hypothetical protein
MLRKTYDISETNRGSLKHELSETPNLKQTGSKPKPVNTKHQGEDRQYIITKQKSSSAKNNQTC